MKITIKNDILIINFNGNKNYMNNTLDIISNKYEGILKNREGHNFPSSYIPENNILTKYKPLCKYVIGIYNSKSIKHELLHAKYYIDREYNYKINKEWDNLSIDIQNHITMFLKKLGYTDDVIIDEYQAYRYTEPHNFFGINLE